MTVVIDTTSNGKFQTFSSTNATLATCLSEVMDALSIQNKNIDQTKFISFFDDTGQEYTLVAIVKN